MAERLLLTVMCILLLIAAGLLGLVIIKLLPIIRFFVAMAGAFL